MSHGSKSTLDRRVRHGRSALSCGRAVAGQRIGKSASKRLMHCSKKSSQKNRLGIHSMASSARNSRDVRSSMPIAFTV